MGTNIQKFKDELKRLIAQGELLGLSMAVDLSVNEEDLNLKLGLDEETAKKLGLDEEFANRFKKLKPPYFSKNYEPWYSLSMQIIKQVIPDRLEDFKRQYRDEKRKETDSLTYGVSDYMIGIQVTRGGRVIVNRSAAFPKFEQQLNILKSAETSMKSSLYNMTEILRADLFDDELDAARELNKKGFVRGAGAITGVVLEKHLDHICTRHELKTRKKHSTINDYNQMLKDNEIIDTPTWRFIQHLGDLRNLCDHNKDRDPKKEEIDDLITGVSKIIKTVF